MENKVSRHAAHGLYENAELQLCGGAVETQALWMCGNRLFKSVCVARIPLERGMRQCEQKRRGEGRARLKEAVGGEGRRHGVSVFSFDHWEGRGYI